MPLDLLPKDKSISEGLKERSLRRSPQRDLVALIKKAGMDPAEFGPPKRTWNEGRTQVFAVIVHKPTSWYIIFGWPAALTMIARSSGSGLEPAVFQSIHEPGLADTRDQVVHADWDGQLEKFARWLKVVKEEGDPTDIWATTRDDVAKDLVFALDDWAADKPFSAAERKKVSATWREIEQLATHEAETRSVPADEVQKIHARFDVIEAKLEQQTKPDWIRGALYALFGIALQSGLEGLGVTRFLTRAATLLGRSFGFDIPELDGPAGPPRIGG